MTLLLLLLDLTRRSKHMGLAIEIMYVTLHEISRPTSDNFCRDLNAHRAAR